MPEPNGQNRFQKQRDRQSQRLDLANRTLAAQRERRRNQRASRLDYPSAGSMHPPGLAVNPNDEDGSLTQMAQEAAAFRLQNGNGTIPGPAIRPNGSKVTPRDLIAPNLAQPIIDMDDLLSMSIGLGTSRRVYPNADEAVRYAKRDAEKMRRDAVIESALIERIAPVALLDWHLEGEDDQKDDPSVQQMCKELRRIILRTPRLSSMIETLGLSIWHGKYGASLQFNWDFTTNRETQKRVKFLRPTKWFPVHGDSIVPDTEGNIGLKVKLNTSDLTDEQKKRMDPITVEGPLLFLDEYERNFYIIHQHKFEAPPFDDPLRAGVLHGVGLRDKVFWAWKQKVLGFTWLMDFLERFGDGLNLWYYEEGNATSRAQVKSLAENQSGRTALLVPRPRDSAEQGVGFEHVEVAGRGSDKMWEIVSDYFDGIIRRIIVGQNLSSESDSTGLGSGVAALQRETKQNLILLDAFNLAETLTTDLVETLIIHNRKFFPNWPRDVKIFWRFEVEDKNVAEAMDNAVKISQMGGKFDIGDLRDRAGLLAPKEGGEVNTSPAKSGPLGGGGLGGGGDLGGSNGFDFGDSLERPLHGIDLSGI